MLEFDLVRVTDVRYIRGHILWLRFSDDGLTGEIDLANDLRGEVFEPLARPTAVRASLLGLGGRNDRLAEWCGLGAGHASRAGTCSERSTNKIK